jgi:glycosyltransferase involved in cell wall biosynthesis
MGGIETHGETIYPRIAAATDEFEIAILARSPYVGRRSYHHAGCRIAPVWTVKHKLVETALHSFLAVLHARFRERCELLHVHAIGPGLVIPLAKGLGMSVVATHHGHDYSRLKWGRIAKAFLRLGEWCMVAYADRIICVSENSAVSLQAAYPRHRQKIDHIPNGATLVDEAAFSSAILDELGLTPSGYVLAVGRLVPEKGFQDLVAAFRQTDIPYKLVVVGAADHDDAFSSQLVAQASPRVVFAGRRRRAELATLYRHAGLFVLPSYHEGLPIVALEALQAAPIVLSDIVANLDLGLPAHHYVPTGDVAALVRLLEDGGFERYRVADKAFVARYDWEDVTARTLEVLRDVAKGPRGSRRGVTGAPRGALPGGSD